jgi:hypothetical protein
VTRLRKMMLEELQRCNYSAITTRNYLRVVADFAKYFGKSPDKLGPNELRTYQAYLLQDRKLKPGTVVNQVAALRFFFVKTLKRHQFRDLLHNRMVSIPVSRELPTESRMLHFACDRLNYFTKGTSRRGFLTASSRKTGRSQWVVATLAQSPRAGVYEAKFVRGR